MTEASGAPKNENHATDTIADDIRTLHSLGYAQELLRRMSGFSNFAISFSIICILAGGLTSFSLVSTLERQNEIAAAEMAVGENEAPRT